MKKGDIVMINAASNYPAENCELDGTYWCGGEVISVGKKRVRCYNIWTESIGNWSYKNVRPCNQKEIDRFRSNDPSANNFWRET